MEDFLVTLKNFSLGDIASYVTIFHVSGITIFAAVGFIATFFFWKKKSRRHKYNRVYFPTDMIDFYRHFSMDIRNAKESIRHVGDGFVLSNPASLKNANTLDAAFCDAMDKGVNVSRFQMTGTAPISWYSRLYALKKKYPNNFHVFMNEAYDSIGSICIIDHGLRKTVFEYQTISGAITGRGTEPVDFAFVYGHQSKSNRAAQQFDSAINDGNTRELSLLDIEKLQRSEWKKKIDRALNDHTFTVIDPEVINQIQKKRVSSRFPKERFQGKIYIELDFNSNWEV